jgi:hypothetical protein
MADAAALQAQIQELQQAVIQMQQQAAAQVALPQPPANQDDRLEAIADILQRSENRKDIDTIAQKVAIPDPGSRSGLTQFLKDLQSIRDIPNRYLVFDNRSTSQLNTTGMGWIGEHPAADFDEDARWLALKRFIIQEFISTDPSAVLKKELAQLKRTPYDTLVSFNRKFSILAEHAYPGERNAEQQEALIQLYARNLLSSTLARKVVRPNWPRVYIYKT